MKKSFYYLGMAAIFLASCSQEKVVVNSNSNRISVTTPSAGDLIDIDQPFAVQGKASTEFYRYRAYAEAPTVNGTPLEATSIAAIDDMVFVSWHTEGANYGGAITAYQFNGTEYAYTEVVSFDDTDWHDIEASGSAGVYVIHAAGQRNPDSSGYFLNGHRGAVIGELSFSNFASPHFNTVDYAELPVHGYGANGIALNAGDDVLTVSGNGVGNNSDTTGVYYATSGLANVSDLYTGTGYDFGDGEYIERDGFDDADEYLIMERLSNNVYFHTLTYGGDLNADIVEDVATINVPTSDVERNAMAWSGSDDVVAALGNSGLWVVNTAGTTTEITSVGSAALGVAVDTDNDLIYVAAAEGGLAVIANTGYATTNPIYSAYDLIGKFQPLTGGPFPSTFTVKDASMYGDGGTDNEHVAIATGSGGVFFIEKE